MAMTTWPNAAQPDNSFSARVKLMLSQPARQTIQPARANITAYTAGPAQSMKRLIDSIPVQNTAACTTHNARKPNQPSQDRPRNVTL